jgi:hypothetical protein
MEPECIGVRLGWGCSFQGAAQENQSPGAALLNTAAIQIFESIPGQVQAALTHMRCKKTADLPLTTRPHFVLRMRQPVGLSALAYAGASLFLGMMWFAEQLAFTPDLIVASGLLLALTTVGLFDHYTWSHLPGRMWQWLAWGLWGMAYGRRL